MKRIIPDHEETKLSEFLFKKSKPFIEKLSTDSQHGPDLDLKPAWVDEDDEQFDANTIPNKKSTALYAARLKQKYESLMGTPNWAKLDKKSSEDLDTQILRKVGHVQKKKKTLTLPNHFLETRKFPNINNETKAEGKTISCVEFHPKLSVALVAGDSGVVSLFSIGGDTNNKLHSFKLKRWKVSAAQFSPNGSEAYLATMMNHYCLYNLVKAEPKLIQLPRCIKRPKIFKLSPDGKYLAISEGFEEVEIVSAASNERLRALKHNSVVQDVSFSHDSDQLYCYCTQGEITIWDLSTYRPVKKFYDNGCVTAGCISNSLCGNLLATGSGEGIVNIYETSNLTTSLPFPLKTVSNLTTKITDLKFNATTEILAISSNCIPNSVKLVHIPTYHVFSNFPDQSYNFNNIEALNFSPNSGYVGMGNNKGMAYLYRLKYYKNY